KTGAIASTFKIEGSVAECKWGAFSEPDYTKDDSHIFWFEFGKPVANRSDYHVVVASADTKTGVVRRFRDPVATTGIGFHLQAFRDGKDDRLCLRSISFHSAWKTCDWLLS